METKQLNELGRIGTGVCETINILIENYRRHTEVSHMITVLRSVIL